MGAKEMGAKEMEIKEMRVKEMEVKETETKEMKAKEMEVKEMGAKEGNMGLNQLHNETYYWLKYIQNRHVGKEKGEDKLLVLEPVWGP